MLQIWTFIKREMPNLKHALCRNSIIQTLLNAMTYTQPGANFALLWNTLMAALLNS